MRPGSVELGAKRDDVRMLEQEEEVRDTAGPAFFDQRALDVNGLHVWDGAEVTKLQGSHAFRRPSSPSSRSSSSHAA